VKPYTQSREFLEKSKREEALHYLALPAAAASAFLAAFSCKAFPSLSRRCSGVRPSSLFFNFPPFLAAAFSLSFSLWFPLVICPFPLKDTKPNHQKREPPTNPKHPQRREHRRTTTANNLRDCLYKTNPNINNGEGIEREREREGWRGGWRRIMCAEGEHLGILYFVESISYYIVA
jgi:hypothetical protein